MSSDPRPSLDHQASSEPRTWLARGVCGFHRDNLVLRYVEALDFAVGCGIQCLARRIGGEVGPIVEDVASWQHSQDGSVAGVDLVGFPADARVGFRLDEAAALWKRFEAGMASYTYLIAPEDTAQESPKEA